MDKIKNMFSSQICDLRKRQKLTQEQASELLDTSTRCLQKWENGNSLPDFVHTLALVHHLGFDLNFFAEAVFSSDKSPSSKK